MIWLKGMLVAVGLAVVIAIAIIAALGLLSSDKGREVRHISMGQRTITITHFKNFTQESTADGVKMVVDDHVITATPDAITVDGETQSLDPAQDVDISVDEAGKVTAKALSAPVPSAEAMTPDDAGSEDAPPE